MEDQKKQIEALIKKASESVDCDAAMKFAQAALNAANAMCSLYTALKESK